MSALEDIAIARHASVRDTSAQQLPGTLARLSDLGFSNVETYN